MHKNYTRREFLGTAMKAGSAFLVSSAIPNLAFGKTPGRKLGVAIVGLGGFASDTVAPEVAHTQNVRIAAVVTGDPVGKGREWADRYGFPKANVFDYSQMHKLASCPDVDFVHVITPNGLHAEHTIAAARAGKHVLCEKPMATNSEDCRRMINECRRAGVMLGVDYRLLWEPHHAELIRLMREGTHGSPRSITAEFAWTRRDAKPWLLDKALAGGGAFFDVGVYLLQAGCYVTGNTPTSISAMPYSTRDVYPQGIEETMAIVARFPGEVSMIARASYAYDNHTFVVNTDKGAYSIDGDLGGSSFGQSWRESPSGKILRMPGGRTFKQKDTLELAVIYDAFADAIANGTPFQADGEMGLRDIQMAESVYEAAASGQRVEMAV